MTESKKKKVALLVESEGSTVLALDSEDGLSILAALVERGHRFRVSRQEIPNTARTMIFAVQGANIGEAMIDARIKTGNFQSANDFREHQRVLKAGPSACESCDDLLSCGGLGKSIPDLMLGKMRRYSYYHSEPENAVNDLDKAVRQAMWETCRMTEPSSAGETFSTPTIKPGDLQALGLSVAKSVAEIAESNVAPGLTATVRKMIDDGVDFARIPASELSERIQGLTHGWNTNPTAFGKAPFIHSLSFDEELYQINVARSRERAARSGATRSENVEFRKQQCSQCQYGCESLPRRKPTACAVTVETASGDISIDSYARKWMFAHAVSGKKSDSWRLTNSGRKRKGIVYGPDDKCQMQIVSLVTPYRGLGSVSFSKAEITDQDHDAWFARFASENQGMSMKHVYWALRELRRIIDRRGRRIEWHGRGRAMKNTVLSVRLEANGTLSVLTDTLAHSWRGSGTSISSDDRPRYSFQLRYPYFQDFRTQLQEFPGSGR